MSSDINFTVASWFLGNVRVKPHSKHSAPPRIFNLSYGRVRMCAAAVVPMIDDVAKTGRTNSMKVYRRGTGDEKKIYFEIAASKVI